MACRESTQSPRESTGLIERVYIVEGTTDEVQAKGEAFAKAPATYRGFIRNPNPDVRPTSRGIFEISFRYEPISLDDQQEETPAGDTPTLGTLRMARAGGTEHVTQCLSQTAYGPFRAQDIVDRRIVGLHRDGVNGVDMDIGGAVWTLTKRWLPTAITGTYLRSLSELASPPKVNASPYTIRWAYRGSAYETEFAAGELRFTGIEANVTRTAAGLGVWEISYEFLHMANRANIQLTTDSSPIIVASKKGHEYLWAFYKKAELTGDFKVSIEVPEMAFVSKLYDEENFAAVLRF